MSVLGAVCFHPGPTQRSDKTEQWPRGGFVPHKESGNKAQE